MARGDWYKEGLRFSCTQCGNCCTGEPGYVFLTREEIRRIAEFLGRDGGTLGPDYLRRVGLRHSLTERPNGDCCFLITQNGKRTCSIYPVRPLQCRTWPFWSSNLASADAWAAASEGCPGMNAGPTHSYVQIEIRRKAKAWEDLER